ncbi:SurA N-terminal domain-containing protein [Nocardioides salsibiostraticola]
MLAGLLVLSACGSDGETSSDDASAAPSASASADSEAAPEAAPEADLEGIPDVVAVVNGESIDKDEFEQVYTRQFESASSQAQATGQPVDQDALKEQTVEGLVGNELLTQEADRLKITATKASVNAEFATLLEQNGLESRADLEPLLEQQGLSIDDLTEQVEAQIRIDQLIEEVTPGALKVTQKEVRALYDQVAEQQEANPDAAQELPPLNEVRGEIVNQIRGDKQGQAAAALVTDLRKDADVTINL